MARREDDLNASLRQVPNAPVQQPSSSFFQRIKLQATNSLEILPKSIFPGSLPSLPPAPVLQNPPPPKNIITSQNFSIPPSSTLNSTTKTSPPPIPPKPLSPDPPQAPPHHHHPSSRASTDEGLKKGLIVLGPETTFASRAFNQFGNDVDEKTMSSGVPCMRTDSLTSSELGLSRGRHQCPRRWSLCLLLAVLFVALGAALGIYFAYQFIGDEPRIEKVFKGKLRVTGVDTSRTSIRGMGLSHEDMGQRSRVTRQTSRNSKNRGKSRNGAQGTGVRRRTFNEDNSKYEAPWRDSLADTSSNDYLDTVEAFRKRMDNIYSTSLLRKAYIRCEILGLDRGEEDSLIVHFNIHINIEKLQLDASDLYLVILSEIRDSNSEAFAGLVLDEESVKIEERKRAVVALTTPPTEQSLPQHTADTISSASASGYANPPPKKTKSQKNTYHPTRFTLQTPRNFSYGDSKRQCSRLDLSFCAVLHHNLTTYPNLMNHSNLEEVERDLLSIRELIDSECHPLALEFMCEVLQPDCHIQTQPTPRGFFEDELIPPCRDFCEEVMGACRTRLPPRLRLTIDCGQYPLFEDHNKCTAKPGCSRELRLKGWPERVCDGVVDCLDMSDEDHCASCTPGSFRCGGGSQCVSQDRKCDGVEDCLNGADERSCLSLTSTPTDENALKDQRWIRYNREGLLRYTEAGLPSRVCVDNINKTLTTSEAHQLIHNMAEVTCDLLTYGGVDLVEVVVEDGFDHVPGLGYVQITDVRKSNITFEPVNCTKKAVVYIACSELACGIRPLHLTTREPLYIDSVVRTAGAGDWPWSAALLKDGVHTCDATLIHATWLLTTASCFQGQGRALWIARMGSVRLSSQAPWVQERLIVGMVKSAVKGSQMVLVKLEEEVQLSDYVRPVCLGSHHNSSQLAPRTCRSLGWGTKRDPLLELKVKVANGWACTQTNPYGVVVAPKAVTPSSRDILCAQQSETTDRCLLEELSGAGLLCEWAGRWEVVGIATGNTGCSAGRRPRLYDDVNPAAVKWIKLTIAAFARENA